MVEKIWRRNELCKVCKSFMCHMVTAWAYFMVQSLPHSPMGGTRLYRPWGYGGMGLVYKFQYPCWVGGLPRLYCLWCRPGVAYLRVLMPWCVTSSWKTSGSDWQRFMLKMWRVSFCITSGWNSVPSVPLNVKNISNDDILYRIRRFLVE